MENKFDKLMDDLGVVLSKKIDSYVHCCRIATIYGITWNLITKKCTIAFKKLKRFKEYLLCAMKYRVMTAKALEYIGGMILHFSQLNKVAKIIAWNIIRLIHAYIRNGLFTKTDCIILPLYIIRDIKFWYVYSDFIKTVDIADILYTPSIAIYGSSDACNTGGGFIVGEMWSLYKFDKLHCNNWHINQKELHTVLTVINTFKHNLTGRKLILYVDNTTACFGIIKKWSSIPQIMIFIYELCLLLIKYKIMLWVNWISSHNNGISDALSRFNEKEFINILHLFNLNISNNGIHSDYYRTWKFNTNEPFNNKQDNIEYKNFIAFLKLHKNRRLQKGYPNYGLNFNLNNSI